MNIYLTDSRMRADEGSLFVCANPTPGTAIATGAAVNATFAATAPHFVVKNNAPAASGTPVWLHSLSILHVGGTAPVGTTSVQSAVILDTGDRTPSAGTSLLTPVNTTFNGKASVCQVWVPNAANPVVPAAVAPRIVARDIIKSGATVLLDEFEMLFGEDAQSLKGAPSAVGTFSTRAPAVRLLPQQFALIYLWFPGGGTNPFSHEFELMLSER